MIHQLVQTKYEGVDVEPVQMRDIGCQIEIDCLKENAPQSTIKNAANPLANSLSYKPCDGPPMSLSFPMVRQQVGIPSLANDGSHLFIADVNVPPPCGQILGRLCGGQLKDCNGADCEAWYAVEYKREGISLLGYVHHEIVAQYGLVT